MLVNQHTKIAALLKHHPEAMETIASINPAFAKLRNPFLRKLMAGRVSIGMAAKIGGCREDDFYQALRPLGFITENTATPEETPVKEVPAFLESLSPGQIITLDVRPLLAAGHDPLKQILGKVKALKPGQVLRIINTFEPTPLMSVLKQKGFSAYTNIIGPQQFETLFYSELAEAAATAIDIPGTSGTEGYGEGWEEVVNRFAGQLQEIDVRELEMPQPMIMILESLDKLPESSALFVHHKRIPVFLLPDLAQKGFDYRSRQLSDHEVQLIIFRN